VRVHRPLAIALLLIATQSPAPAFQVPTTQSPGSLSAEAAVYLYGRGEFDAAVQRLDTRGLLVRQFTRTLEAWIADGGPSDGTRRRRVAAAFALDAGWHATRSPFNITSTNRDPWGHVVPADIEKWTLISAWSQPIVALWAVEQLPAAAAPDAVDKTMAFAAVGLAQDGHAWNRLEQVIVPRVRKVFGDDPRLRLSDVLSRTNSDLGPLRLDSSASRIGALRDDPQLGGSEGRIAKAIAAFQPLLSEPALSGEVELRIGYLELRRKQWREAAVRFDSARLKATEPTLHAIADYFAGWAYEQQNRPDDAIVAYRRAHAITPLMRNLTTRLSALLFLRGDRADAYELLDPAINARPAPTDLLFVFERADARFVPEWLAAIRKAIQ
jgi:tetratricopeptide (TPR) repeat protein